jgi:uncharacterized protein
MKRSKFSSYLEQAQISHQSFMEKVIFLVQICSSQDKVSVIKKDPSDDKFLSCAIASQSSFIISGDTHLLELKSFDNIPIVTPKQFMLKVRKK